MFLKKKNPKRRTLENKKERFYRRKGWKITFIAIGVIALTTVAFFAYILAQGSRIFSPSGSGTQSLLRSLTHGQQNNQADLKGYGEGRINILCMGMGGANHPGGQLTDSIMVVSIKPADHSMAMLSIPRDLYVPIADHKISAKINEAYYYGEKDKKGGGPAVAKATVANTLGIPIHYFLTVDFQGFEKLIDEIGGIDVNVEKAIYDPFYPDERMVGYSPFSIKAGQQHLNGKTALKFARSRETTSDFDRASRQQKVITAVKEKVLNLGFLANPKKILDIVTIVGDHVRTDFSPEELSAMVNVVKDLDGSKSVSKVLSNSTGGPLVADSSAGTYYLYPRGGNFKVVQKIAQNIFDNTDFAKEETRVEIVYNSDLSSEAKQLSETLQGYGYNVVLTVSSIVNSKSAIYDYTEGDSQSATNFLSKKINAPVSERTASKDSKIEVGVVLGSDYQMGAKEQTESSDNQ